MKNGKRNGRQRYKCATGKHQEQNKRQPDRLHKKLWRQHVFKRQTVSDLSKEYGIGEKRLRRYFDEIETTEKKHYPRPIVLAMDATFWGRKSGVFVARDPKEKENLFWKEIETETPELYREAKRYLENIGYDVKAVVIDGKRGVREVFRGLIVQLCQFHQIKTVTRYLTRKPNTLAGQDLLAVVFTLTKTDEKTFLERLERWHKVYEDFLNERTPCSCCKPNRWPYTHRRLRAAYRSIKTNLPFLFTYQKFPELHIPNTTNTLDGSFSHLKNSIGVHRGKTQKRRYKMICEILTKKEDEK